MTTNRETKFVVLTAQRSGSTWFIDILNNLADSTAYTELFLPQRKPRDKRLLSPRTAQYIDEHLRAYPLFWEEINPRILLGSLLAWPVEGQRSKTDPG